MEDNEFRPTLEKAKAELVASQKRLGEYLAGQEAEEKNIARLREFIVTMSKLLGEEFIEEDTLGLTDAIRQTYKISTTALQPTELRDKLRSMGYDLTKYGNMMASIHAVIQRLLSRGEIEQTTISGRPAHQWNRGAIRNAMAPQHGLKRK
jgi:hypothetical protein